MAVCFGEDDNLRDNMTKLCVFLNTPEKVDQRLLSSFCKKKKKKRQSTKLKGSKLKANKKQDVFLHDGQLAVGVHRQESGAGGGLEGTQLEDGIGG